MAKHNDTGKKGETLASVALEQAGYEILHYNWRHARQEVDLVALQGKTLVFVEVKTRSDDYFGLPEESVDDRKQARLFRAAEAYLDQSGWDGNVRFDVVSVLIPEVGPPHTDIIRDAFRPGIEMTE